jgi:hypothetical protein
MEMVVGSVIYRRTEPFPTVPLPTLPQTKNQVWRKAQRIGRGFEYDEDYEAGGFIVGTVVGFGIYVDVWFGCQVRNLAYGNQILFLDR